MNEAAPAQRIDAAEGAGDAQVIAIDMAPRAAAVESIAPPPMVASRCQLGESAAVSVATAASTAPRRAP